MVQAAEAAGMHAILLKSHHTLTADRATLVAQQVGIAVHGGLALNLTVGGINPVAVETALGFGARQIWMPTIHARHCLLTATGDMFRAEAEKGRIGLAPFDSEGNPTEGLLPILEMIRDAGAVLGTGHLAPEESLALLQLARDMNLERLLVTHPNMSFTLYTSAQMKRAVELGAYLEFDALSCHPNWHEFMPTEATARAIAEVGAAGLSARLQPRWDSLPAGCSQTLHRAGKTRRSDRRSYRTIVFGRNRQRNSHLFIWIRLARRSLRRASR